MSGRPDTGHFTPEDFLAEARDLLAGIEATENLEEVRHALYRRVGEIQYLALGGGSAIPSARRIRINDCSNALRSMLMPRSSKVARFDIVREIWKAVRGGARPDLTPAFWADLIHIVRGLEGRAPHTTIEEEDIFEELAGREAAQVRSEALDALWSRLEEAAARYPDGLEADARDRRMVRRRRILEALGGSESDWYEWTWHLRNIITDADQLVRVINVDPQQVELVRRAREGRLPFAVTPHYASLFDDDPESGRDRAVRAQVLPPGSYVESMLRASRDRAAALDFMREYDTSPVDLITRRYPGIVILKPYNTCPQICVYCQRNWEIEEALAPDALADNRSIEQAISWIEERPSIREVLVTGGDPMALGDRKLMSILRRIARISHVDNIRIGTRMPVTVPMRITPGLARMLGSLREPGHRDICVVTHVQHPYEITPDTVRAVDLLRRAGIGVYNQQVYTFHVSRRFESVKLRMVLRRVGIDPYYTFMPKGKSETADYHVPLARILQESKEEVRLLPGILRTDEPVYNVPRLGKNHIRARQHRNLVSIMPDGSRMYEFHPWEKNITERDPYLADTMPILEYLNRLAGIGENPEDYQSIWYYF